MIVPNNDPCTKKDWITGILVTIVSISLVFLYYIVLSPLLLEYLNFLREPWYTAMEYLVTTLPVLVFFILIADRFFWGTRIY